MNVLVAVLFASSFCFVDLPGVDAKCGTKDDANIVTINSNLAISICSESIVRVVKAPSSKEFENATIQTQNKDSLIVDPDFPASPVPKFSVETVGNTVKIATSSVLVKVNKVTNLVQFFSVGGGGARIAEGALITEEVSYKFTPTLDRTVVQKPTVMSLSKNGPLTITVREFTAVAVPEWHLEYSTTNNLVQFNTEAVVPFFASTKVTAFCGTIMHGQYRTPRAPPISVQNGRMKLRVFLLCQLDGDYIFYVNSCSDYGCGMNHYLSLAIADNDPSEISKQFNTES